MRKLLVFISLIICAASGDLHAQDTLKQGLIQVNNTQLFVKIVGTGDTILVIHGGPGLNHAYLEPHLLPLAKTHTLIFYDQRSCGQSQLSVKTSMNFATFANDIEAIRNHFHIQKLNLLAHSWGSLVAATYMLNYPEHVASVVFSNPVPFNQAFAKMSNEEAAKRETPADSIKKAQILNSDLFRKGEVQPVEDLMMLSFRILFCDTAKLHELDPSLPPTYMVASLSMYGFMQDMKDYNFFPKMKDIPIPALIIHGNCDISPLEADLELQKCFTTCDVTIFENSGHFPFVEENKKFVKTVSKFYQDQAK
jgi:proline iminopeptidase